MKSVLLVGLFGVLISMGMAAKSSGGADRDQSEQESRTELKARGDHHGGGGGGGGHKDGHGHVYHETYGQELFQGEEWMLLVPLLLIPLLIFGCWYLWGGSGKQDDGWGWDRMGYSDNSVGGAYPSTQGAYDTRAFSPADAMDKSTFNRILESTQQ